MQARGAEDFIAEGMRFELPALAAGEFGLGSMGVVHGGASGMEAGFRGRGQSKNAVNLGWGTAVDFCGQPGRPAIAASRPRASASGPR